MSIELNYQSATIQVTRQTEAIITATILTGQGPAGPPGGGTGGSFSDYLHTQSVASSQWIINHNLGRNVTVTLRSPGGLEFEAEVLHVNLNQVIVNLAIPTTGTARVV